MSVIRACLAMIISGALVLGASVGATARTRELPRPLPERVLFIGNSHTARNGGLDWLVTNMVSAADPSRTFEATARTSSGVTLQYHYQNGTPRALRDGDFDTIVLQGYLPGSATETAEPFYKYARLIDQEARKAGARTVFFMTWPQGRLDWADLDDFIEAHRKISAELGAPVAPVGVAFERARAQRPDLVLIGEDEVHATWTGAYLAAATVYATLFDRSPEGLSFLFGVSPADAAFLQRIAWETVADWQAGEPATA